MRKEKAMARFEVGHVYRRADSRYDPIVVEARSVKTIWVRNIVTNQEWAMRIRTGEDGNECAVESEIPHSRRATMCFEAVWDEGVL